MFPASFNVGTTKVNVSHDRHGTLGPRDSSLFLRIFSEIWIFVIGQATTNLDNLAVWMVMEPCPL